VFEACLRRHPEQTVFVVDLTEVDVLFAKWTAMFPGTRPYYAVKCNPDVRLVRRLAALGARFDCASMAEIDLVLGLGIPAMDIIYANPCKRRCDLRAAWEKGVRAVTFDNVSEIQKIAEVTPGMECILRIYANDPCARCPLSNKFGAPEALWAPILDAAAERKIRVTGVSFHVGSGAQSASAYTAGIAAARACFDLARARHGWTWTVLDIGGGFASTAPHLPDLAEGIRAALASHKFGTEHGVEVIAEPGRFFAETTTTIATPIIGLRHHGDGMDYWITDSIYGSFNNVIYDHGTPVPVVVLRQDPRPAPPLEPARLFGPTCDGMDIVVPCVQLPRLAESDWLAFPRMGAYTAAGASYFNGIPFPLAKRFYID
jgi:ornithine decarboxylase